jgi:hypothetical protein
MACIALGASSRHAVGARLGLVDRLQPAENFLAGRLHDVAVEDAREVGVAVTFEDGAQLRRLGEQRRRVRQLAEQFGGNAAAVDDRVCDHGNRYHRRALSTNRLRCSAGVKSATISRYAPTTSP